MDSAVVIVDSRPGSRSRKAVIGVPHKCRLPVTDRVAHVTVDFPSHLPDPPVRNHRIQVIGRSIRGCSRDVELSGRLPRRDGEVIDRIGEFTEVAHDIRVCLVDRAEIIHIGAASHGIGRDSVCEFVSHDIQAFHVIIDVADGKYAEAVPESVEEGVVDRGAVRIADTAQDGQRNPAPVHGIKAVIRVIVIDAADVVHRQKLPVLPSAVRVRGRDDILPRSVHDLPVVRHQHLPVQIHQIIAAVLQAPGNRDCQVYGASVMEPDLALPLGLFVALEHRLRLPLERVVLLKKRHVRGGAGKVHQVLPAVAYKMLQIGHVASSRGHIRIVREYRPDMDVLAAFHDSGLSREL